MAGEVPLPVQEYCDDSQVIVLGPYAAADLPADQALWFPDRHVVIDHVWAWADAVTGSACNLRLLRGIGPLGGTGADADAAAVVTAARDITTNVDLNGEAADVKFDLPLATEYDENIVWGSDYTVDGNTLHDFVLADVSAATTGLVGLMVAIRFRSKVR
jgi:hypothetical protein